jgi:hypothetical protein
MNAERDSDRQLRRWVSDGIDRAPERFVWAALDDIEGVTQRPPWRAAVAGWTGRVRPAAGLLGVAAGVAIALAVVLRFAAPDVTNTPGRAFTTADLQGIVLWDDTKPATWTLDNLVSNPHEVLTIPVRSMTGEEMDNLRDPVGYFGGRYTNFTGPRGGLFMSWSAVFVTPATAQAALPFFENELSSPEGWGYGPGQAIELGDGGLLYAGVTTSFSGPPGSGQPAPSAVYLWRDGNILLAVGGWFEFDPVELREVAEGMDARASAIARPSGSN